MRTTIFSLLIGLVSATQAFAIFTIAGSADNDLVRALPADQVKRVDTAYDAIEQAAEGSAVLILADGYPARKTTLDEAFWGRATAKKQRVYVEYPSQIEGKTTGEPQTTTWERGVVSSDFFGDKLPKLRIVQPHDCHYLKVDAPNAHLVIARVAGFDTAVYGIPKASPALLFETHDGRCLIATTKLSQFVTARYAPTADWQQIWHTILQKLDPDHAPPALKIVSDVRFAYLKDEQTPATLERDTFDRAAAYYTHAKLLITKDRQAEIHKLLTAGVENVEPQKDDAEGDGNLGMIEGYGSQIRFDGSQPQRTPIRSDCSAEAAMVLALSGNAKDHKIGANLLDYVYGPEMESMGRSDPKHPSFGLIAWGAISPAWAIGNYGDDDARVILSSILAGAAQKTDRWDDKILRALLANLRTTGPKGFRGDRVDIGPLEQFGWKHFHDTPTVSPAPHFESYLWACNLWAYRATGEKEFLDKATTAIGITMDAYAKKQWRWMDNIERARMILCLSWLVRIEDTPEHRGWLMTVANDMLQWQDKSGAIQEKRGGAENTGFQIAKSNEEYGTGETPLIQNVGDPAADQLYTTGFALIGLHEAVAATHDAKLKQAEDKLADFLCRIQVRSEKISYVDGSWFRAFDYKRWDYWASSGDVGWGVWCVEAGWGQAWIAATLALRDKQTTFWDMTAASKIKDQLPQVRSLMAQNDGSPLKKG